MTSSPTPSPSPRAIVPDYPAGLPITERRDELLEVIAANQVVIVAGETGSGKSTQLPKLCLELGRGTNGWIGHTQPRRIAARAVAERVAEELHSKVGEVVGYTVRFTDEVSADTRVKLMTDGILLAEIQRDRSLLRYDTIIIDEAHERSLNIDFLLGYLKRLLPLRPDLKVIVTSATIDTERFSEHFDNAPVVTVEGRTYPVELRYRPLQVEGQTVDQTTAIVDAVEELSHEGRGDILVFQSGEREIRDTADALTELDLPNTEILPLYARLSAAEQHRVFSSHKGRRIVIATNVAETSLTVPGIRYVVDPGTARISRFNRRTKVQRLPIEPISQASANQRSGRCGRVAPGVCIRLYDEEDFDSRPEFTDPEVLRTNLASVILQMTSLGLGEVAAFPFVEPPESRSIRDGLDLLTELGALEPDKPKGRRRRKNKQADGPRLTPVGRRLARLPLDPRLGRMILEAEKHDCVHEVMVIAAALSIQDPREWPSEKRGSAAELHKRFDEPGSDFVAFLHLWEYLRTLRRSVSGNQFRRTVKGEYLHFLRVREWQDVYSQLLQTARRMKIKVRRHPNQEVDVDAIHRAMLAGLLSNVGRRPEDGKLYEGTRGLKFEIARSSTLAKSPPKWLIASEIVETDRARARIVGRIQPQWIEQAGSHLITSSFGDPYWESERATAMALERVSLLGLTVVSGRAVPYSRVDEGVARAMFIERALVEGDWDQPLPFLAHNAQQMEVVKANEARARRTDLLVDDNAIFRFYDERIGQHVVSGPSMVKWWKKAREHDPELLHMTVADLTVPDAPDIDDDAFPLTWTVGDHQLDVSYAFELGAPDDGITVSVPVTALDQIDDHAFDWHVPGHRDELVTSLLRTLPKAIRRQLVPIADTSAELAAELDPTRGSPIDQLTQRLTQRLRLAPGDVQFDLDKLDPHLRVAIRVVDGSDTLATGHDLRELRKQLGASVQAAIADVMPSIERDGLTSFDMDELPRSVSSSLHGQPVEGFPTLVDEGETVAIRVVSTRAAQRVAMWQGTRRLLRLQTASPVKALDRQLTAVQKLSLTRTPHGSMRAALDDCIDASIDRILADHGGPVWTRDEFDDLVSIVRETLVDVLTDVVVSLVEIVDAHDRIRTDMQTMRAQSLQYAARDIDKQLDRLLGPRFVTSAGVRRLPDVARYLAAIERRLEKARVDPDRDSQIMRIVLTLEAERRTLANDPPPGASAGEIAAVRWMIEELRVSLFAQELGTAQKVSEARIRKELARLGEGAMTITIRDGVRSIEHLADFDGTVAEVLDQYIAAAGLPRRSVKRRPIGYGLARQGATEPLDPGRSLASQGVDDEVLELVAPDSAHEAWHRAQALVRDIGRDVRRVVSDEVDASADRVRDAAEEELRSVVRSVTHELEGAVVRGMRGLRHSGSRWVRRRIGRNVSELEGLGVVPKEIRALAVAAGRLSEVAKAAMVVPLAVASSAAVVVAAGSVVVADAARDDANRARDIAESLSSSTTTTQPIELAFRPEWEADVVDAIEREVLRQLAGDRGDDTWVQQLLGVAVGDADGRIDQHRNTRFRSVGRRQSIAPGETLWEIAELALRGNSRWTHGCEPAAVPAPTTQQIADYAAALWIANVGSVGADPNALEAGREIQLVCPAV